VTYLVLDTRVLSFRVFSDQDSVDIIVGGLVSLDGNTWSDVGEKGECSSKSQVERDVSFSDCPISLTTQQSIQGHTRGSEGTLQGNSVGLDTLDGLVGDDGLAVF
jgi:hypothetical protein